MSLTVRTGMVAAALVLAGCATTDNPRDPFEKFNRAMFTFNDKVDQVALKPAAEVYKETLPSFMQTGIGNFFGNLGDVWTAANNLLQGKIGDGMSDVMRVAFNSTFGIGGLFDWASEAGLPRHKEDFGQTLGFWGAKSGPYLVLPLLGPSTVRDALATPLDLAADPWSQVYPVSYRYAGTVVRVIDQRAVILDASNLIEEAALDRYVFVRDGYLQRRESVINDGNSPRSSYQDEEANASAQDSATEEDISSVSKPASAQAAEPSAGRVVETERSGSDRSATYAAQEVKKP